MDRAYQPLPSRELGANAGFRRPMQPQPPRVSLESAAADVMTALTRTAPATIRPQAPLAGANQFMITRGVRLLLVTDDHENVLGLITATDILGEKPVRVATERGLRRQDLTVEDVMTPAASIDAIAFEDLRGMHVGHVLQTLRHAGRQHALVVEMEGGRTLVRGIFSTSQIARQLGVAVPADAEVARTFSEIESAIK
jgi:CBS domain-containing protein